MQNPKTSVIFVNYNTRQMTIDAINSVFEKTVGVSFEVIVVDNASADGSVEAIREVFGERVKVIEAGENLGFGRANNLGVQHASGEYVYLLNTDTLLINDAITIMSEFLNKNSEVGAVCSNQYTRAGKILDSHWVKPLRAGFYKPTIIKRTLKRMQRKFRKVTNEYNNTDNPVEVRQIVGASLMIRKQIYDEIGGFDKDIFMYAEDIEICIRIAQTGFKLYNVPTAKITHFVGESSGRSLNGNERRHKMNINGSLIYFYKSFGEQEVKKYYKNFKRYCSVYSLLFGAFSKKKRMYYKRIKDTLEQEFKVFAEEKKIDT